tara:strand:+ start:3910 stop:5808 length:1899 start_codon:yes stop_codon:yes gene_type:complete
MLNLYLVQTVDKYGPNSFLPLAISYQWMYAQDDEQVKHNYNVADVLIEKTNPKEYVDAMHVEPHIVAMSNYVWNWEYNKELAKEIKKVYPNCDIVVGGPNVDKRNPNFFVDFPMFDIAVLGEGEPAFRQILKQRLMNRNYNGIPSVFPKGGDICNLPTRFRELETIPSPILNGFYDMIIDKVESKHGKQMWQVTYETLRGCPYQCAFCDIGDLYWNKIAKFDMPRIEAEIDWMARREIEYVGVCDSNWGMLQRDLDITAYVIKKKQQTGYPKFWDVTWAKTNSENIYQIAKMDKDADTRLFKGVTFAMQSLNPATQKASKRVNLKSNEALTYMNKYQEENIPTYSELIWPMPDETYDTLKDGIQQLVDLGQKSFLMVHPLVLTFNATMGQKHYIEEYGLKWKEVPLDTYYLSVDDLENYIVEKTMGVYATNTADEVLTMRGNLFSYLFITMYYYGWAHYLMEYMQNKHDIKHVDFIESMLNYFYTKNCLIGREIRATEKHMHDVFYGDSFWGRQVLENDIYWEYKGATSVVFHQNRQKLKYELIDFVYEKYEIDVSDVVEFNIHMCKDPNIKYPYNIKVTKDTSTHCLNTDSTHLQIDHWDKEALDERKFYHVGYHWQRKNHYWKCTPTTVD